MNDRLNQEEIRTAENRLPPEPAVKPKKNEKRPFQVELYTMLHDLVNILAVVTIFFTFIVRLVGVSGPSMTPTLIDGDYVLVQQASTASNGEIVVALIEDSATVKTFYKEQGYIRLQPENDSMDPIIVEGELSILGKVIGVFRYL